MVVVVQPVVPPLVAGSMVASAAHDHPTANEREASVLRSGRDNILNLCFALDFLAFKWTFGLLVFKIQIEVCVFRRVSLTGRSW